MIEWRGDYRRDWLRPDLLAGLATAAVAVPNAMACWLRDPRDPGGDHAGPGLGPAAGVVASFISEPVLTGFKAGSGLVISLDQVPKPLGIHFDKDGLVQNLLAVSA